MPFGLETTVHHQHYCFCFPTALRRHRFVLRFFNTWRCGVLHILWERVSEGIAIEARATEQYAFAKLRARLGFAPEDLTLAYFRTQCQDARARQVGFHEGHEGHEAGTLAVDDGDEGLHGYEAAVVGRPKRRPKAAPWGTWV